MDLDDLPPPSSEEARALGCTCPVEHQGKMWRGMIVFIVNEKCPIHGEGEEEIQ